LHDGCKNESGGILDVSLFYIHARSKNFNLIVGVTIRLYLID
jgi:hypothetical protein